MTQEKAIFFYQENNKIKTIFSDNPFLIDNNLNEKCEVKYVPLKILPTDFGWQSSQYLTAADPIIQSIIQSQHLIATSKDEESELWAMMVVPVDKPDMSRTGVLVKKEGGQFTPLLVTVNSIDYLIEVKGCGSPIGGFPKFHFRSQAGAYQKGHLRLCAYT